MEPEIERFIEELNGKFEKQNARDDHQYDFRSMQDELKAAEIPYSQIDPVLFNIDLGKGYFYPEEEDEEEDEEDEFYGIDDRYDDDDYDYDDHEVVGEEMEFESVSKMETNFDKIDNNHIKLDRLIRTSNNVTIAHFPRMDNQYVYFCKPSTSKYEPRVVRELVERPQRHTKKRQLQGLCPYCETMRFYEINSSAYLHHLTINHGIFSNGNVIKDPIMGQGYVECPYEGCQDKNIKLKRQEHSSRFKAYCRHVKLHHYEGKNS